MNFWLCKGVAVEIEEEVSIKCFTDNLTLGSSKMKLEYIIHRSTAEKDSF